MALCTDGQTFKVDQRMKLLTELRPLPFLFFSFRRRRFRLVFTTTVVPSSSVLTFVLATFRRFLLFVVVLRPGVLRFLFCFTLDLGLTEDFGRLASESAFA